jgi:hypothetical protein
VRNFWAIVAGIVGLVTGFVAAAILSYVIMDWADVSFRDRRQQPMQGFADGRMRIPCSLKSISCSAENFPCSVAQELIKEANQYSGLRALMRRQGTT